MRAREFMIEVFNRPWDLNSDTPTTQQVKKYILAAGDGKHGLNVYQHSSDPSQIIFTIFHRGAWEVHHVYYDGNPFISGDIRKDSDISVNTGFPATAIKLYKELLDQGESVRVTAPNSELWDRYSKFIDYFMRKHDDDYIAFKVNYTDTSIQGNPQISQIIRKFGTKWLEEALNVNVRYIEYRKTA